MLSFSLHLYIDPMQSYPPYPSPKPIPHSIPEGESTATHILSTLVFINTACDGLPTVFAQSTPAVKTVHVLTHDTRQQSLLTQLDKHHVGGCWSRLGDVSSPAFAGSGRLVCLQFPLART